MDFIGVTEDKILEVSKLIREGHRGIQKYKTLGRGTSLADLYDYGCKGCYYRVRPSLVEFCGLGGFRVNYMGTCDSRQSNGLKWKDSVPSEPTDRISPLK